MLDHDRNVRDIGYRLDHGGKYKAFKLAVARGDMEAFETAVKQSYPFPAVAKRIIREATEWGERAGLKGL